MRKNTLLSFVLSIAMLMACSDDGFSPQLKQTMLQEVEHPLHAKPSIQYYDGIRNDRDLAEAIQNGYITINDEKIFLDFDTSEKNIPENERITIHNGVQSGILHPRNHAPRQSGNLMGYVRFLDVCAPKRCLSNWQQLRPARHRSQRYSHRSYL